MILNAKNSLKAFESPATVQLESRVLLSSSTLLTQEVTQKKPGLADDGFASITTVGQTSVAALNNAWNRAGFRAGEQLTSRASVRNGIARITVARAPRTETGFRTVRTKESAPFGFPTLLVGNSNGVRSRSNPFTDNGIPLDQVDEIPFTFNSNGGEKIEGIYNNTLDIWFGQERRGDVDAATNLLMLQSYNSAIEGPDVLLDPTDPDGPKGPGLGKPTGDLVESNVRIPGFPGVYDIWFGGNAGTAAEGGQSTPTASYVRRDTGKSNLQQFENEDLKLLIDHAVENGYVDGSLRLNNVFAGTEVWNGAVGSYNELAVDVVRN